MSTPTMKIALKRPGLPEVIVGVVAYIAALAVTAVILKAIPDENGVLSGLVGLLLSGVMGLVAFVAAVSIRIRRLSVFGIRRASRKSILLGAGLGVATWIVGTIFSAIYLALSGDLQNVQTSYQSAAAGGALAYLGTVAFGALVTPLGEELFFRGVIANALGRFSAWISVLVSAAVFAVAHGINPVLPIAFLVGVATAVLFRRTGSVWPGVAVHALNNATALTIPLLIAAVAA